MPTWPAELDWVPNNGKPKETPPIMLIQDDNDEGPSNARSRMGVRKLSLPYRFNGVKADIFDAWLLATGALPFDFWWPPPPRTPVAVQARITAVPTYEHVGGGAIDVTLEVIIKP